MLEFRANLCTPSDQGNQAGASRPPAPTPLCTQQQQAAARPSGAKGNKVTGKKRKRPAVDLGLENPHPVDPSGFMEISKEAARAEASRQHRQMEVAIYLDQPSQEGDYTPDPDVMTTINKLLSHL